MFDNYSFMLQCCRVLKKKIGQTFKNCFSNSSALFRQKQGQHGPHPKSNSNFSEMTKKKVIISFRELVILSKYHVLTEFILWMILCLARYVLFFQLNETAVISLSDIRLESMSMYFSLTFVKHCPNNILSHDAKMNLHLMTLHPENFTPKTMQFCMILDYFVKN